MTSTSDERRTHYRTCPLCEATCGLEITTEGDRVVRIRGDMNDPVSKGFICPKGSTLKQLHEDPNRLRAPVARRGVDAQGAPVFEEISWDEAWRLVDDKLRAVREAHGNEAVGLYLGNPNAHLLASSTHLRPASSTSTRSRSSISPVKSGRAW